MLNFKKGITEQCKDTMLRNLKPKQQTGHYTEGKNSAVFMLMYCPKQGPSS